MKAASSNLNPELEMMYKWEEIGLQDKAYGNSNAPDPDKMKPDWGVPIIDYTREDKYPLWMRALGKWNMAFRKGVLKLPMSHLFYELGSDDASEH